MSVATATATAPGAPAGSTSPPRARPCSILRPCSNIGSAAAVSAAISHGALEAAKAGPAPTSPVKNGVSVTTAPANNTTPGQVTLTGGAGTGPDSSSTESLDTTNSAPSLASNTSNPSSIPSTSVATYSDAFDDSVSQASTSNDPSTPRSNFMSSPKIRFGNCPERPPELKRRNSIALGVLSRRNMLQAQGSTPSSSGTVNKVYMTDQEWADYQAKFAARSNAHAPVDLGAVVSSGAKNLWSKVRRRGSNASITSTSSNASAPPTNAPANTSVSPRLPPVDVAPPIKEEDEEGLASPRLGLTGVPQSSLAQAQAQGDATPRARSPSPAPALADDDYDDGDDTAAPLTPATEDVPVPNGHHAYNPSDHPQYNMSAEADDPDVAHRARYHNSGVAALGFDYDSYKGRGGWDRRSSAPAHEHTAAGRSQSSSPTHVTAQIPRVF